MKKISSRFAIGVLNETSPKYRVPLSRLKRIAKGILKELGFRKAGLSVLLVGDRKMRACNRRYLNHDRATDVLAFGGDPRTAELGDILISLDTTRRQAKEYGNSFDYELAFYLCHGILHLTGEEDRTPDERQRMWKKQERILKRIGITPRANPKS